MYDKFIRGVKAMELEDQILHVGVVVTAVGVFFPWFGDQRFGTSQTWSGFDYYTGYIGWTVFLVQLFIIAVTVSPMLGGPVIVKKAARPTLRLALTGVSIILLLSAFSVLLSVTFGTSSGVDIRMGIYLSLIGSAVALLYAFLRYQQHVRSQVRELFHHPDEEILQKRPQAPPEPDDTPPPPPPPPPLPAEDHNIFTP